MPRKEMDIQALEDYAIQYGVSLAGWTAHGTDESFTPLEASQVSVAVISAVSTYARTREDYDPDTDITDVVRMGVYAYGSSIEANFVDATSTIQEAQQDAEEEPDASIPVDGR